MEDKNIKFVTIGIVAMLAAAGAGIVLLSNNEESSGEKITLAFGNSSGYQPMLYAYHAGLFKAEGLDVTLHLVASSGPSVAALLSGRADMAFTSPEPVFSALNEDALKVKVLCNSRLPGMSSMHTLYNNSVIDTADFVKKTEGGVDVDTELINFANQAVASDGTVNGKIALHMASSYRAAWIGFVELLYRGGIVYGVEYPANQINETQYSMLINTSNTDVYLSSKDYSQAATYTLTGEARLGIGSNAAMASAAAEGNEKNPGAWEIMSTPSLIDSGFATILASDKAISEKYSAIVKVLRAIDKAGVLMRDESTAPLVAEVCAPLIYNAGGQDVSEYVEQELAYYSQVRWDICHIENTIEIFRMIAELSKPELDPDSLETIFNLDLTERLMDDVHLGGKWKRAGGTWTYV